MKIQVVSSRWTIWLKLILPVLWMSAMMALSIFFFTTSLGQNFGWSSKILLLLTWLGTIGLWYALFSRIKWLGLREDYFFVSNFFKSYQYTYESIARLEEDRLGPFRRITIHLHQTGAFGAKLEFFVGYYWYAYLQQHPSVLQKLLQAHPAASSSAPGANA